MQDKIDILIDETKSIDIVAFGEKLTLKKLSLKQVLQLTKILGKIFTKYSEQVKSLKMNNKSNSQDVLELFGIIDESEVSEIIAILIAREPSSCIGFSFKEITDIISAVIDLNYDDFSGILKNFQRISSKLTPKVQAVI